MPSARSPVGTGMKHVVRRMIGRVVPTAPVSGVRVLLYHAIGDPLHEDRLALRVSRQRFIEQMAFLEGEGYSVVPLAALDAASGECEQPRVAITFDDGYDSQLWAADQLHERGFAATFFLVPRFLDGCVNPDVYWESWGYLGWDDAAQLSENFEVGAHSATHRDLTRCQPMELEKELRDAKRVLEERVGRPVRSVSYPFGRENSAVRATADRAGYRLGCTSRYGTNRHHGKCLAVRRIEIAGTDDLSEFRRKVQGRYDWVGYWQGLFA